MAIEFPAALKLVKEIAATAKRLGETRDEFKLNEISIQLQRLIIDLQNEITLVQSGYQTVLRTQDELKKSYRNGSNGSISVRAIASSVSGRFFSVLFTCSTTRSHLRNRLTGSVPIASSKRKSPSCNTPG